MSGTEAQANGVDWARWMRALGGNDARLIVQQGRCLPTAYGTILSAVTRHPTSPSRNCSGSIAACPRVSAGTCSPWRAMTAALSDEPAGDARGG